MTVGELISMLEGLDEEANVFFMSQPNWPFEYSIEDIVERSDFENDETDGKKNNDVILVEGAQIRYGNKNAWDAWE
jgi:hypothetical protein